MNKKQNESMQSQPFRVAQCVKAFFGMVAAEWRQLVADVSRAFVKKRQRRGKFNGTGWSSIGRQSKSKTENLADKP
jgi:uncharacterized metal-binding protein